MHPYYPIDADVAGYVANELGMATLVGAFFAASAMLFTITYLIVSRTQPRHSRGELLVIMWFVLSGAIHVFFEGYYVTHYQSLGSKQTVRAQIWKEYALSDSRYLTQNPFVLCVETLTAAFMGPGCFLVAALIISGHPLRYPIQSLVSMGQLYGVVLYYLTAWFEYQEMGLSYWRPEPFYFWVYFVFLNIFWVIVPGILIYQSTTQIAEAMRSIKEVSRSKRSAESKTSAE